MYQNILSSNQTDLLPLISDFSKQFYLVGGTAIALQIGHRESIDFDLFTAKPFKRNLIKKNLGKFGFPYQVIFEDGDQLHMLINDTKLTFYEYPYPIEASVAFDQIIYMPNLLSLAAMKAFALGKRAKWRDYVDLYFLLRDHFGLAELITHSENIYSGMFNAKLFLEQLTYYQDVDYRQPISFVSTSVSNHEIESFLTDLAVNGL